MNWLEGMRLRDAVYSQTVFLIYSNILDLVYELLAEADLTDGADFVSARIKDNVWAAFPDSYFENLSVDSI